MAAPGFILIGYWGFLLKGPDLRIESAGTALPFAGGSFFLSGVFFLFTSVLPKLSAPVDLGNTLRGVFVAKENNIHYVAFPAISCGVYGYPYDEAASVAISTVKEFVNGLKEVHFVLFSDEIYDVWSKKAKELLQNS
ncbi:Hypothetical predicted protein [Olea europaea subsp. europaea]|uniref:Macro domain-containing protein n=1 Tax=Olea europaea subsp. europaea TaxID=158383 RepID=A0A8S0QCD9_OLEEU|nr:Hypothetical predicted protein [Olea europaea subsp. europaea]